MTKYFLSKTSLFYGLFLATFASLLLTSCSQSSKEEAATEVAFATTTDAAAVVADEAAPPPPTASKQEQIPSTSTNSSEQVIDRKLLKEGNLKWETSDINKTHTSIIAQAKKYNAYISNDNQSRNDYEVSTDIELRIPSDKFDELVATLEKEIPKFDEKNIKVLDVTEEFIDVSTRIKTKKELEQHYYDLLKQTKNVSEVLLVEEQLNAVRTEIESAEGRLKYLNDRISMSTLNLSFYETTSAPVGFFGEIGKSFAEGWKGFLFFILGIIRIWPMAILALGLIYFIIKRRRNRLKSKNE
jgi:hypothetical protein